MKGLASAGRIIRHVGGEGAALLDKPEVTCFAPKREEEVEKEGYLPSETTLGNNRSIIILYPI